MIPIVSSDTQPSNQLTASDRRSLRKRWIYLLPAVFITYSLAYLDRANFGFGAAAGMAATLHITGKQLSLLGGLFFLGYFVFQLPGVMLARRGGVTRVIFVLLIAWGAFAALTGVIHRFWVLAVDRVLLGISESLIFPAMVHLLTHWFTRAERSRSNTILMFGNPMTVLWMSVITGYLIQNFGWQKTFILEGIPSIVWAGLWLLIVRDKPLQASWMTGDAAQHLEIQLEQGQVSLAPVGTIQKALMRSDVLLLSVQYFSWSVGVYGFVLWLPTIVRQGASLSMGKTGLLSALPYLAAILGMAAVSILSDKMQRRQLLVWPFLLLSGVALFGSYVFLQKSFSVAFVSLIVGGACMYAPYGPFFAIVPERLPRNVTAEVFALINSCGALGGFLGSYLVGFLQSVTGKSSAGILLMSLSLACSAILLLCLPALPVHDSTTITQRT